MTQKQTSRRIRTKVKVPISFRGVLAKMRAKGAYSARIEGGGMEIIVNSDMRRVAVQDGAMKQIEIRYSERAVDYYLDEMRLESPDRNCMITYRLPPKSQI